MSYVSRTGLAETQPIKTPPIKSRPSGKSVDGQSVSSGAFHDLYVSMPRTPRLTAGPWFAVRETWVGAPSSTIRLVSTCRVRLSGWFGTEA